MFEFKETYLAYLKCRKLKRNTINALRFDQDLISNLYYLEVLLNNKTYTLKRSVCFMTSSPKLREIFFSDFQDRVVHHIIAPILEQIYEPTFMYDSYSNRANKGIYKANKRALHFLRGSRYFLQLDIKNFFCNIDKDILLNKINKAVKSNYHKVKNTKITMQEIMYLCKKIIYQDISKNILIKAGKDLLDKLPPHKTLLKYQTTKPYQ